jgi:proline dehydrogenase
MNLRERFIELLPKQAIRIFSAPYVAGDSMESALAKTRQLANAGQAATIDVLGEDVERAADIEGYVAMYSRLTDALSRDARLVKLPDSLKPSISMKPSMFVIAPKDEHGIILSPDRVDWAACEASIGRAVAAAAQREIRVTIDMESHQWTDFTLRVYAELFRRHGRLVGTVLQSRLLRTARDVETVPESSRIRLCTGIYDEPAAIAFRRPGDIKSHMIPLARRLLERRVFLEFATHDLALIDRFFREVAFPMGLAADQFETQTLLGVPRQNLISGLTSGEYFSRRNGASVQLQKGIVHRLYVPFAAHWDQAIAYCRRRLRHSPNLFWTGFVNAPRVLYYSLFRR